MSSLRFLLIACALILVACKPSTDTPVLPAPTSQVASMGASSSAGAQSRAADEFGPCLEAAESTTSVTDDEARLRSVQFLMACSESYVEKNPNGPHADDALRIWYKGIAVSNEILPNLETRAHKVAQDPTAAQQQLVSQADTRRLAEENGHLLNRAFQHHTIQAVLALYEELKASGIKMESSVPTFNAANLSRKRTGVWELTLNGSYDEGNFIVVSELGRKDPMFSVAGFGSFAPVVTISDEDQIASRGWYGRGCTVKVTAIDRTFSYRCDDYLSGTATKRMLLDMRRSLEEALVTKANNRQAEHLEDRSTPADDEVIKLDVQHLNAL
jgi:hypothetical protein